MDWLPFRLFIFVHFPWRSAGNLSNGYGLSTAVFPWMSVNPACIIHLPKWEMWTQGDGKNQTGAHVSGGCNDCGGDLNRDGFIQCITNAQCGIGDFDRWKSKPVPISGWFLCVSCYRLKKAACSQQAAFLNKLFEIAPKKEDLCKIVVVNFWII